MTCAPLVTKGFTRQFNENDTGQTLEFYYGDSFFERESIWNWTYSRDLSFHNTSDRAYMTAFAGLRDDLRSTFRPITQLQRSDADVTLIFVENAALYTQPVQDMFFHAENVVPQPPMGNLYEADQPVSVMGCTEQYQFCRPNNGPCSDMVGQAGLDETSMFHGRNLSIAHHVGRAIYRNQLDTMIYRIGSTALLANQYLEAEEYRWSAPLSDTHWASEIQGWHWYMMARLQREMYDFAAGPSDSSALPYLVRPSEEDRKAYDVCTNQKIRDSQYYSINILGLAITLSIGCFIILVNLCLSTIVGLVQSSTGKGLHCREQWIDDYILHLQRLAYENAGVGTWMGKEASVPTTVKGEILGKAMAPPHGYAAARPQSTPPTMNLATPSTQEADSFLPSNGIEVLPRNGIKTAL